LLHGFAMRKSRAAPGSVAGGGLQRPPRRPGSLSAIVKPRREAAAV